MIVMMMMMMMMTTMMTTTTMMMMTMTVEGPRFRDSRHMNMASLSALRTGRLYTPGNIPAIHFR
jgi:hypothetical protein